MIEEQDGKTRFFLVWDATEGRPIEEFAFEEDAFEKARQEATDRLGNVIVVFEPKEAFQASARTERVYLKWPERPAEVGQMPAVTDPIGNPAKDEDGDPLF